MKNALDKEADENDQRLLAPPIFRGLQGYVLITAASPRDFCGGWNFSRGCRPAYPKNLRVSRNANTTNP
jgi:hypothetical protein